MSLCSSLSNGSERETSGNASAPCKPLQPYGKIRNRPTICPARIAYLQTHSHTDGSTRATSCIKATKFRILCSITTYIQSLTAYIPRFHLPFAPLLRKNARHPVKTPPRGIVTGCLGVFHKAFRRLKRHCQNTFLTLYFSRLQTLFVKKLYLSEEPISKHCQSSSTTVMPAPPNCTCSSRNERTPGTVRR